MNKGTNQNIITQLGMTADEYNLVAVVYYVSLPPRLDQFLDFCSSTCQVPYIVGEAPSNLLLKYFTPSKWQSRIMIGWGVFLMCHAAVKNKGGLFATRFLLGLVWKANPGLFASGQPTDRAIG